MGELINTTRPNTEITFLRDRKDRIVGELRNIEFSKNCGKSTKMKQGSLNTPPMSTMSSQESIAFASGIEDIFQQDPDVDISDLLEQQYDLAQVSSEMIITF